MTCDNPEHDDRFSGVFFLPKGCNGCLACFVELQQKEIKKLKAIISNTKHLLVNGGRGVTLTYLNSVNILIEMESENQ